MVRRQGFLCGCCFSSKSRDKKKCSYGDRDDPMYGVLHYKNKTITENEITDSLGNDGIWA